MISKRHKVTIDYLSVLLGKRAVRVAVSPDDDIGDIYGIEFDDGTVAWILCDPEGNGPGHLDIQKPE